MNLSVPAPRVVRHPMRPGSPRSGGGPPLHSGGGFFSAQASAAELRLAREADIRRTVAGLTVAGTPVRVGRYALVESRQDPAARLAETQSVVHRHGWQAPITTYDSTGMTDPVARPQLARLCAEIRRGEIHGIVAASRMDISGFHSVYADALTIIRAYGGFLALARPETTV